jgi:hypothetical protein
MKFGMATRKYTFRLGAKYCLYGENDKHGDGLTLQAYVQQIQAVLK